MMSARCAIRCALCTLAVAALAVCALPVAAQESLGDVARRERNTPKPHATHVYTNDDLPSVPEPAPAPEAAEKPANPEVKGDQPATPEGNKAEGEKPKAEPTEQDKIKELKDQIAALEKKIADLQNEERQRSSAYYGDVGVQLRAPEKWNADMQQIRDQIAAAQKELADKRSQLSDAEEAARKANRQVP